MIYQVDAADAEDGHKSMWLKSSANKVIEADLRYMLRCFDYDNVKIIKAAIERP